MGRVPARSRAWGPRGDTPVPTRSVSLPAPWWPYSCASTHNAGFVLSQALPRRREGVFCVRGGRGVPPGCSGGVGRVVPSRAEPPGAVLLFRPRCGHREVFQLSPCPPGAAGSGGDEFVGSQPALGPCFALGRGARSWGASVGTEQVRSRSGAGPAFPVFLGPGAQCQQDFLRPGTFPALGLAVVTSPAPWLSRGKLRHGGGRVLLACGGDLMAPWGPHPALPAGLGCAGSPSSVREVMGAPGMGTASLHGTATPEQDGGCVPTKTPAGG